MGSAKSQNSGANAIALPFRDESFDAVVTSPTYGNRFADKHNAKDGSIRRSYTHDLGRTLHAENSGSMQWGQAYRDLHVKAWAECFRVVRPGGLFVLNISDHVVQNDANSYRLGTFKFPRLGF